MNKMPTPMKFKSIEAKTVKSVSLSIISRALIITIAVGMSNCASLIAKKNTYGASGPAAKINGAEVRLQVNPQGAENGAFSLSAMVVSTTVATMEGPFRWRVEAIGDSSVHQSIVIHRIFTSTEKSKRKEWYPTAKLSKRADFREVKERPGKSRARYEIPGLLQVTSAKDGKLSILCDISIWKYGNDYERKMVKFLLDPAQKRQDEFIFLPVELVKSFGKDLQDMEDPSWDQ